MNGRLSLGFSPCPNDTCIFWGLAEGHVDLSPFSLDITVADVEVLNQRAVQGSLDITKISIHAMVHLLGEYRLLRSGGALGRGCGPLVVAARNLTMQDLSNRTIAVPGRLTTANLLLKLNGIHRGDCVVMPFDRIMPAVARGEVDGGVIIHEGRFTYPSMGLQLVLDLGAWWEMQTGLPLPLGGIIMKRSLGRDTARFVEARIRESLHLARQYPDRANPFISRHAQEMEPKVIGQHIDMFVNDFSLNLGSEGETAVKHMLEAASKMEGLPFASESVFWDEAT